MLSEAQDWYRRATSGWTDWSVPWLLAHKRAQRIAVIIPARDEASTIAPIVSAIADRFVRDVPLVDELIVLDSDSTDATAALAAQHGATVHAAREVRPDLGWHPGKGEALWKSLWVTRADILVFLDADLTDWGPHFVSGLLGPLLADSRVSLVKGFYQRSAVDAGVAGGGRVTELTARPLLNLWWPELAGVVQPLAGEWAIRRSMFEQLSVPTGYGVEIAALLDVFLRTGLPGLAQVDLGRRAHLHQADSDLALMAAEILAVAARRAAMPPPEGTMLTQFGPSALGTAPTERAIPLTERGPAIAVDVQLRE